MAEKIIEFINKIDKFYSEFSTELVYNKNLKKIGISEILKDNQKEFNEDFGEFIKKYRDALENTCYNIIISEGLIFFGGQVVSGVKFSTRLKLQESIMHKI